MFFLLPVHCYIIVLVTIYKVVSLYIMVSLLFFISLGDDILLLSGGGDTLDGDGREDLAITARIRNGWTKFRELFPFLTSSSPSLEINGRENLKS